MKLPMPVSKLVEILQTCRYHGSEGEKRFIHTWLSPLKPTIDGIGNLHVKVGTSRTLFSAHTDTVQKAAPAPTQRVAIEGNVLFTQNPWPMGADDGTGIWIMLNMIHAGIPGYYIFHRGEEVGGIGSSWLAENMPELLGTFDRAIAFDRAGTDDVITYQASGRCCSDDFAKSLAQALNAACKTFQFRPDDTGMFTDTANYIDHVPECTNLSVGYYNQHTNRETQDLSFANRLALACITVDWESLPTVRDPRARDPQDDYGYGCPSRSYSSTCVREIKEMSRLIAEHPDAIAEWFAEEGYDSYELETLLLEYMSGYEEKRYAH